MSEIKSLLYDVIRPTCLHPTPPQPAPPHPIPPHPNPTQPLDRPSDWAICGNQIDYSSTRPNLPRDTYPLLNEHIRVLIYNGDWDACVPYTDNEAWTEGMGYPKKDAWHAWSYNGQQVGGYATVYDTPNDFTFITVRGGRHEVPETQPERAMAFFTYFLDGTPF